MNKVLAKQTRKTKKGSKTDYYRGTVIGRQRFVKTSMAIFDNPGKEYEEDKLLVKMSNGEKIQVWESETFKLEKLL